MREKLNNLSSGLVSTVSGKITPIADDWTLRGFSPENPFYIQMGYTNSKQLLSELREKAINWEADYASQNIKLERDIQLRDDERAYNSPAAQISRERAAGLNPDLQGAASGGSSSGSGSLQSPDFDSHQLTEAPTPYRRTQQIVSGLSAAANIISAVGGFASAGVDTFTQVANLGNVLKASAAQADAAEIAADTAKQIQPSAVQESADRAFMTRLDKIASISEGLDADANPRGILQKFGITDEDGTQEEMLKHFLADPKFRAAYNARKTAETQTAVDRDNLTYDYLNAVQDIELKSKLVSARTDLIQREFQEQVQKLFSTSENADTQASVMSGSLQNNSTQMEQQRKELKLYCEAYDENLRYIDTLISESEQRVADIQATIKPVDFLGYNIGKKELTANDIAMINKERSLQMTLRTTARLNMEQTYNFVSDIIRYSYQQSLYQNSLGGFHKFSDELDTWVFGVPSRDFSNMLNGTSLESRQSVGEVMYDNLSKAFNIVNSAKSVK